MMFFTGPGLEALQRMVTKGLQHRGSAQVQLFPKSPLWGPDKANGRSVN